MDDSSRQDPARTLPDDPAAVASELAQLRRLRELDALLPALTAVLDLRQVFGQVSEIARKVLPHDVLAVVLHDEDGQSASFYAASGTALASLPERYPIEERGLPRGPWEYEIVDDVQAASSALSPRLKSLAERLDHRSLLRLPLYFEARLWGTLQFASRERGFYGPGDVLVASRIRDHVALALSHHRLAEEARRLDEAREAVARAEARVKALTAEVAVAGGHGRVLGTSPGWQGAISAAAKVAATETTVLVLGESGTGKELVARFIHRQSARSAGPFVAINCAALPEALLESELFGFEKGAFTGAVQAKPGRIEQAAGGVLFLDEIGEMALSVQAKLLRFLQDREFQRLGSTKSMKADVRIVAATNRDLKTAVDSGAFREDLYYRVTVFEIAIPPLRERRDDIAPISAAFLQDVAESLGRAPARLTREALDHLLAYRWPGNVRELRNVLERASILCDDGIITPEHLAFVAPTSGRDAAPARSGPTVPAAQRDQLSALERVTIERVLAEVRFNKAAAARRLGITRGQLYLRLKKHGLDAPGEAIGPPPAAG